MTTRGRPGQGRKVVSFDDYIVKQCSIKEEKDAANAQLERFSKFAVVVPALSFHSYFIANRRITNFESIDVDRIADARRAQAKLTLLSSRHKLGDHITFSAGTHSFARLLCFAGKLPRSLRVVRGCDR
jgi:hypothetical protein